MIDRKMVRFSKWGEGLCTGKRCRVDKITASGHMGNKGYLVIVVRSVCGLPDGLARLPKSINRDQKVIFPAFFFDLVQQTNERLSNEETNNKKKQCWPKTELMKKNSWEK